MNMTELYRSVTRKKMLGEKKALLVNCRLWDRETIMAALGGKLILYYITNGKTQIGKTCEEMINLFTVGKKRINLVCLFFLCNCNFCFMILNV